MFRRHASIYIKCRLMLLQAILGSIFLRICGDNVVSQDLSISLATQQRRHNTDDILLCSACDKKNDP